MYMGVTIVRNKIFFSSNFFRQVVFKMIRILVLERNYPLHIFLNLKKSKILMTFLRKFHHFVIKVMPFERQWDSIIRFPRGKRLHVFPKSGGRYYKSHFFQRKILSFKKEEIFLEGGWGWSWGAGEGLLSYIIDKTTTWQESWLCTAKNIRRFYGKITGNQLPVHFPYFYGRP